MTAVKKVLCWLFIFFLILASNSQFNKIWTDMSIKNDQRERLQTLEKELSTWYLQILTLTVTQAAGYQERKASAALLSLRLIDRG